MQHALIRSVSDRALSPSITNSAEFFPSGISLVIQLCLHVISRGMIAGNVIRHFTFLGEAESKVLPSTQNGAHQKKGWPLPQTQSQQQVPPCSVLGQEWKLARGDVAQATAASAEKILNLAEKSREICHRPQGV